jgi:aspartokinase
MEERLISGILQRINLNALAIAYKSGNGVLGKIVQRLAHQRINIEFANKIFLRDGHVIAWLCVDSKDLYSVMALLKEIKSEAYEMAVTSPARAAILSLFPHREHPIISGIIIQTLSSASIPLLAVASSLSSISCVIHEDRLSETLRLLSKTFGLS